MAIYQAPLRDMKFVLHELLDMGQLAKLPGYEEATPDLVDAILEEAAKFCEAELFPLNHSGDEEGCTFENGVVRTPKGFKEAYKKFAEGGWISLTCDPKYGGQGMPHLLNIVIEEMIVSANLSFGTYPGLSGGAYNAIALHGSQELKDLYLPHLVDGSWSGTMCLTEPQCGTDLGLIRTKATPRDGGSYGITGAKIFITAGEHDLTENILHLVLARLPDAPPGIKGISLFLVPKFLPKAGANGAAVGAGNGVRCGAIEHKMGIKASATCEIVFDDAEGWLVGEPHKGMRCMFTMMNAARLGVGMQGLGLAEVSYQSARAYARERLQGRAIKGAAEPDKPADPIIVHPDVRRMLLTMKSITEGIRAMAYWIGLQIDLAQHHPDEKAREAAQDLTELLTPIAKAFFTDHGFAATNLGVQIYGGHGYIREHGMEQFVRDARIGQLYEGANGVQALDLVGRKLMMHGGRFLTRFFDLLQEFLDGQKGAAAMAEFTDPLGEAFGRLKATLDWLAENGLKDPDEAAAGATEFLRLFGFVAVGLMWARMAEVALAKAGDGDAAFYQSKLATARFYMARVLPETATLATNIMAGSKTLMALDAEAF